MMMKTSFHGCAKGIATHQLHLPLLPLAQNPNDVDGQVGTDTSLAEEK